MSENPDLEQYLMRQHILCAIKSYMPDNTVSLGMAY